MASNKNPFVYEPFVNVLVHENSLALEILHTIADPAQQNGEPHYRNVVSRVIVEYGKPLFEYKSLIHERSPYVTFRLIRDLNGMKGIAEDDIEYDLLCHAVDELRKLLEKKPAKNRVH